MEFYSLATCFSKESSLAGAQVNTDSVTPEKCHEVARVLSLCERDQDSR